MVGHPAGDIARVLRDQFFLAGGDIGAEHVEYLGVALVMRHDNVAVIVDQPIDNLRANFLTRRQVFQVFPFQVDRYDVEILVAAEILHVQNAVALPEIAANVACRFASDALGFTSSNWLHKYVQATFVSCKPR